MDIAAGGPDEESCPGLAWSAGTDAPIHGANRGGNFRFLSGAERRIITRLRGLRRTAMGNTPSAQERLFVVRSAKRSAPPDAEHHFHDAVDLASGRIETTVAATLPTPAERVKRLSHLGLEADPSLFGSPTYRLTPQSPYQPAPEAWLDAFDGTYSAGPGVDQIWWRLPASFPTEFMPGCNFSVRQLAAGPCVMSLAFEAWPYQGATGVVVVDIGALRTEFEISAPISQIVDIGFDHDGSDPLTTMVFFRPGLIDFVFHSMALGRSIMSGSISPWPVVKSGSNGHPVKTLQHLLRARGQKVAVDGAFGPKP